LLSDDESAARAFLRFHLHFQNHDAQWKYDVRAEPPTIGDGTAQERRLMLFDNPFPSGAMALVVLAAFSVPALGGDLPAAEDGESAFDAGAAALELGQGLSLAQDASPASSSFSLAPAPSHATVAGRVAGLQLRLGVQNAGLIEVSRSFGNGALSVSMSQALESNAPPGAWSTSALSPHVPTSALQVAGAYMIAPKLAIAGQAAYGVTPGVRSSDSLATEISKARTNGFSFALVAADRVRRGDRLSVSLSQPMRAYSGRIAMDVLSQSGGSGASRERLVFSMVPIGREMRAQLNYQMPAGVGATFGVTLTVRRNPNNLEDAAVETRVVARYLKSF
jgi:hypothetical protein